MRSCRRSIRRLSAGIILFQHLVIVNVLSFRSHDFLMTALVVVTNLVISSLWSLVGSHIRNHGLIITIVTTIIHLL